MLISRGDDVDFGVKMWNNFEYKLFYFSHEKSGLILTKDNTLKKGKSYSENTYRKVNAIHSEELLYVDWTDRTKTAHTYELTHEERRVTFTGRPEKVDLEQDHRHGYVHKC